MCYEFKLIIIEFDKQKWMQNELFSFLDCKIYCFEKENDIIEQE